MTPPINIDGSTVDAITIDGTEVTQVTADGEVVFGSAIPDNLVNRVPFTEGSGTTAAATVGSADVTLNNGGNWISSSEFEGGTAPEFDGSSDSGDWGAYSDLPITLTTRVRIDPNGLPNSFLNTVYHFKNAGDADMVLGANPGANGWVAKDDGKNRIKVSDSLSGGDVRILAYRIRSSELALDVYQPDATTKVGSSTFSNPTTSFSPAGFTVGNEPGDRGFGDGIDLTDVYDTFLSDATLDQNVADVYG